MPSQRRIIPKKQGNFHHGDLRRALLEAAGALLDRRGPLEVGLRAVARAAGVSQTAPYRHFADKEALLAAVAAQGLVELGDQVAAASSAAQGPEAALRAIGRRYVELAVARPHLFRLMFGPEVADKARYPEVREAGERAFAVVVAAIATGQRAGLVRAGDPGELALVVWSAVHGFASLIVDGRLLERAERLGGPAALGDRLAELLRLGTAPR